MNLIEQDQSLVVRKQEKHESNLQSERAQFDSVDVSKEISQCNRS